MVSKAIIIARRMSTTTATTQLFSPKTILMNHSTQNGQSVANAMYATCRNLPAAALGNDPEVTRLIAGVTGKYKKECGIHSIFSICLDYV